MSTEQLPERLRAACNAVRSKSFPLSDLIPLMQQAADAIAAYRARGEGEAVAWVDPETLARLKPGLAVPATLASRCFNRFTQPIYTSPIAPDASQAEQAAMYVWLRTQVVGKGVVPPKLARIAGDVRAMDHEMDDWIRAALQSEAARGRDHG